jgi:hypothetical protein
MGVFPQSLFPPKEPKKSRVPPVGASFLLFTNAYSEAWMLPLRFICPATGNEVDTGIDLDGQNFAALSRDISDGDRTRFVIEGVWISRHESSPQLGS